MNEQSTYLVFRSGIEEDDISASERIKRSFELSAASDLFRICSRMDRTDHFDLIDFAATDSFLSGDLRSRPTYFSINIGAAVSPVVVGATRLFVEQNRWLHRRHYSIRAMHAVLSSRCRERSCFFRFHLVSNTRHGP